MIRRTAAALLLALLAAVAVVPVAGARDDEVKRRGDCELSSQWRLVVRRESRTTLRVRYVLDTDRAGQTWSVFLSLNGNRLFTGQRTTNGEGYIRITRFPADRAGDDVIKGSANNLTSGETCNGSLVFPF